MKILSVVSARPNFIKLAAVHHALAASSWEHDHVIVHTGQHHDPLFSDVFFQELAVPVPQVNLGIHGGTNEDQQRRVVEACVRTFKEAKPDLLLVYGDVNGAVAAAKAALACDIRIAHVEAGLRSGDLSMPEEVNRIAIDAIADHLFVTEQSGMDHLKEEGVRGTAHFVGNTMIDTLIRMLPAVRKLPKGESLPEKYAVVTLHRPGTVDDALKLRHAVSVIEELGRAIPLVFPVHLRTKARLEAEGLWTQMQSAAHCIDPLPYMAFLRLVLDAHFVLTDSGGIQEETTYLQKKCFTARPNTERPVTCTLGSNELVDLHVPADLARIVAWARSEGGAVGRVPEFWDGKAGERIVEVLRSL